MYQWKFHVSRCYGAFTVYLSLLSANIDGIVNDIPGNGIRLFFYGSDKAKKSKTNQSGGNANIKKRTWKHERDERRTILCS